MGQSEHVIQSAISLLSLLKWCSYFESYPLLGANLLVPILRNLSPI